MKKILIITMVLSALGASWFVSHQYMGTFIRGEFSSFGQEYDPHEKRIAEFFGLITQTFRYRIPEGKKMIVSAILTDESEAENPHDSELVVIGEGFWGTRGTLTIYEYIDRDRNEFVYELHNRLDLGSEGSNITTRGSIDLDRWRSGEIFLSSGYHHLPRVAWQSPRKGILVQSKRFENNPIKDQMSTMNNMEKQDKLSTFEPDILFEITARLEEVNQSE